MNSECSALTSPWLVSAVTVHPGKSSHRRSVSSVSSQARESQSSSNSHSRLAKTRLSHYISSEQTVKRTVRNHSSEQRLRGIFNGSQLGQHSLHLFIDLEGWRGAHFIVSSTTSITLRRADWLICLAAIGRLWGLFTGTRGDGVLRAGDLRWQEKERGLGHFIALTFLTQRRTETNMQNDI